MAKSIQLRNVPDSLYRQLKARAAREGLSLSAYVVREMARRADQPTIAELRERLSQLPPVAPDVPPAVALQQERNNRRS